MPTREPTSIDALARTGGLLLVDKPNGMTSHDVVVAIRRYVRPHRVGHTGTLDPLASGLLILCVGEATKIAGFVEAQYKLYHAVALLGVKTDTQDVTGKRLSQTPIDNIAEDRIREAARLFVGVMEQRPPAFSAIKVGGVPAYKLARRRKNVQIRPRQIDIRRFEVERVRLPRVELSIECSKGTYVRTLCNDLGAALGVGGCLESLRRLAVGRFKVADARPLAELGTRESIMQALLRTSDALSHMPAVTCTMEQAKQLAQGMKLAVSDQIRPLQVEDSWARALGPDGELIAMGTLSRNGDTLVFHPRRVLASSQGR
jgi:tRNA pseudouridine55 synthase